MGVEQASAAAMETILHATRAANSGQQDAANALAQLTQSATMGMGIGGMTSDAQGSLLMDVLQQVGHVRLRSSSSPQLVQVGQHRPRRPLRSGTCGRRFPLLRQNRK
jgi:hypothetical protein